MEWYALHVRSNAEAKVAELLERQNIEHYLPIYEQKSRWSDRTKVIRRPLFPGYLFSRLELELRWPVLRTPGVLAILGAPDPVPVPDSEVESVRALVARGPVEPWPASLTPGEKVIIGRGPLAGVIGSIVHMKGVYRVVVTVEMLGRAVAAEIDADTLLKA